MVLIDGGAATHTGAKNARRAPDLERSAGLSTSMGGGGAGATSGSRAAGGITIGVWATGIETRPLERPRREVGWWEDAEEGEV